jgi:hypothetical protein
VQLTKPYERRTAQSDRTAVNDGLTFSSPGRTGGRFADLIPDAVDVVEYE